MNENVRDMLMYLGIDTGLVSLFFSTQSGVVFWATGLGSLFFSVMVIISSTKVILSKEPKKILEETSFIRLKKALLELKDGYPDYVFYGKIEYFVKTGKWAVDLLDKHGIIEKIPKREVEKYIERMAPEERQKLLLLPEEDRFRWYRLAAKGIDLTISMINLEHSEILLKYTRTIKTLTWVLAGLTFLTLLITIL